MNDVIIGTINNGSFYFPIEFEMFGNQQYIADAVFDTGCSHSLISASSLNLGGKTIEEFKKESLYDVNVILAIGKGVESKAIDTKQLNEYKKRINSWKRQLIAKGISKDKAAETLQKYITNEMETVILSSTMIRYEYLASGYKINGIEIGNFNVKVSFNLTNVNLIGMHIIKDLYTKIFSSDDKIYLLSMKNCPLADLNLDIAMDELKEELELSDSVKSVS